MLATDEPAHLWWEFIDDKPLERISCEVDDVALVQPIGFIWFSKPRYRVRAGRRVVGNG